MITILLTVSRADFLEKVITCLELQDVDHEEVNILCIVDGSNELYVKTRNLVNGMKFNQRLTVQSNNPGEPKRLEIRTRRMRIANNLNQARDLIQEDSGYIFSVEDDTTFGPYAIQRLKDVMITNRAAGFAEGVELGRWGVPYVGAWKANDIYNPTLLTSVENKMVIEPDEQPEEIDAGGLYCSMIRADLFKQHTFTSENGLGPDVNFGLELRQLGYQNFIAWNVPCQHHYIDMGKPKWISPADNSRVVALDKVNDVKWHTSY